MTERCPICGRFLVKDPWFGRRCSLETYVYDSASAYPWEHE